jgi:hypothetical protein
MDPERADYRDFEVDETRRADPLAVILYVGLVVSLLGLAAVVALGVIIIVDPPVPRN